MNPQVLEAFEGFRRALAVDVAAELVNIIPAPARLLTFEQAADALGISAKGVQGMVSRGKLAAVRVGPRDETPGGSVRIELAELERYVASRRVASQSVT